MEEFSLSTSNNTFSIDLYTQLKKNDGNLFISPFSIFTALTMVYVGARTATAEEFIKILHLTLPQRRIPLKVKELVDKLLSIESTEIDIANSVWLDNSYEILESFLYIIDQNYEGAFYKENFKNVDIICNKINSWVSDKTKQKILKIIGPDNFDPSVKLILLNAIYFNGKWEAPFKEELTQETPFYLLNGELTPVSMMHQKDRFLYFEDEKIQILEMPYKCIERFGTSEHCSMFIFLPKEKYGLNEIENKLTLEIIEAYLEKLWSIEVKVYIPKFKMEKKYELKKDLIELGMNLTFSEAADFTGIVDMSKFQPPYISEIIHKAYVDVNEQGTEAAAVTMIGMAPRGMPIHRENPVFKADHPFMFLIQDSQTKTILFLGRILNPSK